MKAPAKLKPMTGRIPASVKKPMPVKSVSKYSPVPKKMKEGGNWIQGAIKKPGALREQLGVKKGGKLGQRARLAITLGKMNKK